MAVTGGQLPANLAAFEDFVGRYREIGFDEFIVPDFTLGDTFEARLDAYRTFMEETPHDTWGMGHAAGWLLPGIPTYSLSAGSANTRCSVGSAHME